MTNERGFHSYTILEVSKRFQIRLKLSHLNRIALKYVNLHYSESHQESVEDCGVCGVVVESSKAQRSRSRSS